MDVVSYERAKHLFNRRLADRLLKPGPPRHPLWSHLAIAGKVMQSLPSRAAPKSLIVEIQRQYNLPDIFYFDTWPIGPAMLVAMYPGISNQFTVKQSLPKHHVVADFTEAFGGRANLVSSDGMEWKTWRSAFNPGFSASHLMKLMPDIVEDVSVFCQVLEHRARTCRRNCIGQELALLELRMVLAMTVVRFDFAAAFDELDELRNDGSGYPSDSSGIHELFGEQAYQIQLGTAKPREGMPCRIRLAS